MNAVVPQNISESLYVIRSSRLKNWFLFPKKHTLGFSLSAFVFELVWCNAINLPSQYLDEFKIQDARLDVATGVETAVAMMSVGKWLHVRQMLQVTSSDESHRASTSPTGGRHPRR